MFSALNRFISRLDSDTPTQNSTYGAYGFQVLRNKNADLAIEPWFDYIVGINGRMIDVSDPALFAQEVRNCAGSMVTLGIWSAKGQRTHTLHIAVPSDTATLGLTLQWTSLSLSTNIWHILDVPPSSPADLAGLLPYSDYILGTPEGILHGESGLSELVEDHIGRPLRLYVYNSEYDVTRELTIQPSRDWGGEGALGCVLGYGALHRLPAPLSEPVAGPGETLFEGNEAARFSNEEARPSPAFAQAPVTSAPAFGTSSEFLVPAEMISAAPPSNQTISPGTTSSHGNKKKGRGHNKVNLNMDDYFNEGEKKSRELDYAPSVKGTPPPPPKVGGPPIGGPPKASPSKPSTPVESSAPVENKSAAEDDVD